MNRSPTPYAPDMFSETSREAQFGARVLRVLAVCRALPEPGCDYRAAIRLLIDTAEGLGLMPEKEAQP